MLSNSCKYAIKAVLYIAVNKENRKRIGIKQISEDLDIPAPFLSKILQILAKNHVLNSTKGPNGGFSLKMSTDEIHLMDIIEIIGDTDNFNKCIIGVRYCAEKDNLCAMHKHYSKIREELKELFYSSTIEKLVKDIKKGKNEMNI